MSEKMKDTKELVYFVCELASALEQSLEDNSIGFGDLSYFFGALSSFGAAFEDCAEVLNELKQMTEDDKKDLYAYATENFDIQDDKIEALVEAALKIALDLIGFVNLYSTLKIEKED